MKNTLGLLDGYRRCGDCGAWFRPGRRRVYCATCSPKHRAAATTDRRYRTQRWRRVREQVLRRDGWACWIPSCAAIADVADHVEPVTATTSDSAFYDLRGLRASCRHHNVVRGMSARLERETAGIVAPGMRGIQLRPR